MSPSQQSFSEQHAFNGAALIDAQGREIPITEQMVQQACERLETIWTYPTQAPTRQAE